MATRRARLQNENVEPFGRAVDGCSQAGRTRPDDNQVAHVRLIDRKVETKAIRDFLIGGIAQDVLTAADDDRNVGGADVKVIEQMLYVRIPFEVDVCVGIPVAHQKLFDA